MPIFGLFGPPDVAKLTAKRDVGGLIKALDYTKDVSVRTAAAAALGEIGDARAAEPLAAVLKDTDPYMHRNVIEALVKIGQPAVEPLTAMLRSSNEDVRLRTAEALGQLGDARAVDMLGAVLKDSAWRVRKTAVEALEKIGGVNTVEPLAAALNDSDEDVRKTAVKALVKIDDVNTVEPLSAALKNSDWVVGWTAAEALGQIGGPVAMEALVVALKDSNVNRMSREYAVKVLEKIGDARAVEPLVAALKDSERYVRQAAAKALTKFEVSWDADSRAWYAVAMGDWDVATSLGTAAVEPLVAELKDSESWSLQPAIKALGRIGDVRAVEPLVAALKDSEADVRKGAAEALGRIGDARAVEPLLTTVQDPEDKDVRASAAEALIRIGQPAVEPLVAALKGSNWGWSRAAATALTKLGVPGDTDTRAWYAVAMGDWNAATSLGSAAVEPLVAALNDSNELVRRRAVEALGKIGDARAKEPLGTAVKDKEWIVREAAAAALSRLGVVGDPGLSPAQLAAQLRAYNPGNETIKYMLDSIASVLETGVTPRGVRMNAAEVWRGLELILDSKELGGATWVLLDIYRKIKGLGWAYLMRQ